MQNKFTTIEQAAMAVKSGMQIVMSANLSRSPMAILRQIVKQGTEKLRIVGVVGGDLNIDFLVGANAVASVDTCSVTMGEFARTGPNFSRHLLAKRVLSLDNT